MGLARLIDEFGLTHEAAAKAVGRSRSAVTNLLRLTHLAKPVQEYLMSGALDMGHARALLALPAAQQTVDGGARRQRAAVGARDRAARRHAGRAGEARRARRGARRRDADTVAARDRARRDARRQVRIEPTRNGAGRLVIGYSSLDQLDGILARIR